MALALAERIGAEIVSVDSMQVYREMDIGTAKPSPADQERVRHHMIDLVEPEEEYTVAEFQREGRRIVDSAEAPLIIAGGSGLHFRALVDPLVFAPHDRAVRGRVERLDPALARDHLLAEDPDAGRHVDLSNPRRVARALEILELTGRSPSDRAGDVRRARVEAYEAEYSFRAVGLDPGGGLMSRIDRRLAAMLDVGFLSEVERLDGRLGRTAGQAVGYRQLLPVVHGECSLDTGVAAARRATRALARRQRTYFHRDPRIEWIEWSDDPAERLDRVTRSLEQSG